MKPVQKSRPGRLAVTTALAAALTLASSAPPVRLNLFDAAHARGLAWTADFSQSLEIDVTSGTMAGERAFRIRAHVVQAAGAPGDSVRMTIELDSARAYSVQHDTRQILDARQLPGTAVEMTYARAGGRPAYRTAPPAVGFGAMVEAPVPVSLMLDHLFPPMPDRAVQPGDTWERTWSRQWLDGRTSGEQSSRMRFRFDRIVKSGSADVARIVMSSPDDAAGPSGFALVGIEDGVVHEVSLDASSPGTMSMGPESFQYRQKTTIRIKLAGGR